VVDVEIHLAGGIGQGEALSLPLDDVHLAAEDIEAASGVVVGRDYGGGDGGRVGEGSQETGDGREYDGLHDVVGVAQGRVALVRAAVDAVGAAVAVADHRGAAAAAVDDAVEWAAVGLGARVAGPGGALAADGGVGLVVPVDGVLGIGAEQVGLIAHVASVEVVEDDVADGCGAPVVGAGGAVWATVEVVGDGAVGEAAQVELGDALDGRCGLRIDGGAGDAAGGGVARGLVAERPEDGDAGCGAGAFARGGAADTEGGVLAGAHHLDGVDVAGASGGVADLVGGGGDVDFGAGVADEGDDLVGQRGIAAEAVHVDGVEDVDGVGLAVLTELAVGGHGGFGVAPEYEIASVARDSVDADDGAADCVGEIATGALLISQAGFAVGGLGFATDGAPEGDAEGRGG